MYHDNDSEGENKNAHLRVREGMNWGREMEDINNGKIALVKGGVFLSLKPPYEKFGKHGD